MLYSLLVSCTPTRTSLGTGRIAGGQFEVLCNGPFTENNILQIGFQQSHLCLYWSSGLVMKHHKRIQSLFSKFVFIIAFCDLVH